MAYEYARKQPQKNITTSPSYHSQASLCTFMIWSCCPLCQMCSVAGLMRIPSWNQPHPCGCPFVSHYFAQLAELLLCDASARSGVPLVVSSVLPSRPTLATSKAACNADKTQSMKSTLLVASPVQVSRTADGHPYLVFPAPAQAALRRGARSA